MADSVISSGDSDDGPLFMGTTSKEVAAPAVESDSSDSGLLIVGATPAPGSSKTAVADSDEEDEELLAVAAAGLARPAEAVAMAASTTTNSTRYKWPKPSDIFKGQPDEKLYAIVKQALVERPWSSKSQTKAWDIIVGNLRLHHSHVFNLGISGSQASVKFNMIMKETKRWSDSAPFRSGGDDESENSFVQACKEIVELRDSWKALEDEKKCATAASKEKDKKAAEVMRRASIGNFTRDDVLNLKRDETPTSRGSTPTPSSAFRTLSSVSDLMASSAESLSDHRAAVHQRNEEKAQRKKQKLVLAEKRLEEERIQSAQKLALEEKRFEEERTQAAHARALELRKMELEEQKWAFMMNNQKKE